MKVRLVKQMEFEVKAVEIEVPIRLSDGIPSDLPGQSEGCWCATIDLETGKIKNWHGPAFMLRMYVGCFGIYRLCDARGLWASTIVYNYVPHGVIPGEDGETIILDIGEDGTIANWPQSPDLGAFAEACKRESERK
jgi:hypothetical protein